VVEKLLDGQMSHELLLDPPHLARKSLQDKILRGIFHQEDL
jgi:hypothetical protein